MPNLVVDENIPGISETFSHHGQVQRLDGRLITAEHLQSADALVVRSVTQVNASLLANTPVRFVGTATIGLDHLDLPWLEHRDIHWASAPGCNADAAAQYTLAMMLLACHRTGIELKSSRIGIIGLGNVGSRLRVLLRSLGVSQVISHDPPLAAQGVSGLSPVEDLFDCNILSLHVPLTTEAAHPTFRMIDRQFLAALGTGSLLVNSSRGKVVNGEDLLNWLRSDRGFAALDVFPDEPFIAPALIESLAVATPHVAGYSLDGKWTGTEMIYRSFCEWADERPVASNLVSRLDRKFIPATALNSPDLAILNACPVLRDDQALRESCKKDPDSQARLFDRLRKDYPDRRDFAGWSLPQGVDRNQLLTLQSLGFH